jgi:hypothetical protein
MGNLISKTPETRTWSEQAKSAHAQNGAFGRISTSVIWSDAVDPDGELVVPIEPRALVADIRANSYPLLNGHDPGFSIR